MEKVTRRTAAHQRYRLADTTIVPGVTTILGVLAKPALVGWANRMGLQGIDTTKYVDEKAEIGTCCHYLIECHVKNQQPDLSDFAPNSVDQAENGFLKFLEWERQTGHVNLVSSELQVVSESMRCGGTVDLLVEINSILSLLDIKTSGSGIWPEMRHQVAAYHSMLIENGYKVSQVFILRVGRSEEEGFEYERVEQLPKHLRMFHLCREIYDLQKELK